MYECEKKKPKLSLNMFKYGYLTMGSVYKKS